MNNNLTIENLLAPSLLIPSQEKKDATKEEKALLALSAILLETVKTLVAQKNANNESTASTSMNQTTISNNPDGPPSFAASLIAVAEILAEVEVMNTKYEAEKSKMDYEIGQGQVKSLQAAYQKLQNEINELHAEEAKASKLGILGRIFGIVSGILGIIVSLLLGQPELAIMFGTMLVMQQTGAMNKVTDGISKGIQDLFAFAGIHLSDADAQLMTSALIVAAAIALSAGAANVAASTDAADNVAEQGASTTGRMLRVGFMGGTQAASFTNFAQNIVGVIPIHNKEVKEYLTIAAEILQALIAVASALAAGSDSAAQGEEGTTTLQGLLRKALQLGGKFLPENISITTLFKMAFGAQLVFQASEGITQIGAGAQQVEQGILVRDIASANSNIMYIQSVLDRNDESEKQSAEHIKENLKEFSAINKNLSRLSDAFKALANLLTSAA